MKNLTAAGYYSSSCTTWMYTYRLQWDLNLYAYEKMTELIRARVDGTDGLFHSSFTQGEGLRVDRRDIQGMDDITNDIMEYYIQEVEETGFWKILKSFEALMDGIIMAGPSLYCDEIEEKYDEGIPDGSEPEVRQAAFVAACVPKEFREAIPGLDDFIVDCVLDSTFGDDTGAGYMTFKSEKVGRFLEWAESVRRNREIYRALRLWDTVRFPLGDDNEYSAVKDGVWYQFKSLAYNGYYTGSGLWSLRPEWYPALVLFNEAVDRLNARYKFYFYKEVRSIEQEAA